MVKNGEEMVKKLVLVWFKWFKMHALMNFNVGYCSSAWVLFIGSDTRLVHGLDTVWTRNGRNLVQAFHRTPGVHGHCSGRDQGVSGSGRGCVREDWSLPRSCPVKVGRDQAVSGRSSMVSG